MGGLGDFAGQMCETLNKTTGKIAVITDRDACIAVAGTPRRDLADKRISSELEQIMEGRQIYQVRSGGAPVPVCEDSDKYVATCAAPILSEGGRAGLRALRHHRSGAGQQRDRLQSWPRPSRASWAGTWRPEPRKGEAPPARTPGVLHSVQGRTPTQQ